MAVNVLSISSWLAPPNLYAYHVGAVDIDTYLHSRIGHMQTADRG